MNAEQSEPILLALEWVAWQHRTAAATIVAARIHFTCYSSRCFIEANHYFINGATLQMYVYSRTQMQPQGTASLAAAMVTHHMGMQQATSKYRCETAACWQVELQQTEQPAAMLQARQFICWV